MPDLFQTMAKAEAGYTAKDIEVLEGLEPVRRRPGMYIGGTDERALHHLVAEVLDNAMDEAVAGHATRIEVKLEAGNRVTISREFMGPMATYRPVLHYDVSDYTRRAMLAATEIADHVYRCMGIAPEQILSHYDPGDPSYMTLRHKGKSVGLSFIGAGHHMGTHRMGNSPKDSVTDRHSRAWDHDNLYIVGCGSMVTSGSANPTLTGAALSLMAADAMLKQLQGERA